MQQRGWIYNAKTKAEWRIAPKIVGPVYLPMKLPYIILSCEDDYSSTVIGYPSRAYLWIMAREPAMSPEAYQKALDLAKSCGYDLSHLRVVPQIEAQKKEEEERMQDAPAAATIAAAIGTGSAEGEK
ncbi:unnamed protein product [Phaeothamnion confervicola]